MKSIRSIVIAVVAVIIIIAVSTLIVSRTNKAPLFSEPTHLSNMKKVTSYEIHMAVSTAGKPVSGNVIYQLEGEATQRQINGLGASDLAIISSVLSSANVYFDLGLNEFVRKS